MLAQSNSSSSLESEFAACRLHSRKRIIWLARGSTGELRAVWNRRFSLRNCFLGTITAAHTFQIDTTVVVVPTPRHLSVSRRYCQATCCCHCCPAPTGRSCTGRSVCRCSCPCTSGWECVIRPTHSETGCCFKTQCTRVVDLLGHFHVRTKGGRYFSTVACWSPVWYA